MKPAKKLWRPPPVTVVGLTAMTLLALVLALNWLSARRGGVNAHVEIAAPVIEAVATQSALPSSPAALPDGEVERTAERLREVSALVMGLTLLAVDEGLNHRPLPNVASLIDRFARRNLLPPTITANSANGALASPRAVIYVRYRPAPLAIEVVSLGREREDGPAIIGRIATGDDEEGAALFVARGLGNVALPAAFTPTAQMAEMNWTLEPLRERVLTSQEQESLGAWLQAQRSSNARSLEGH